MDCETPKLILPNTTENYTLKFNIGVLLEGFKEYEEINETRHNISVDFQVTELAPIERQTFAEYDSTSGEPLSVAVRITTWVIMWWTLVVVRQ